MIFHSVRKMITGTFGHKILRNTRSVNSNRSVYCFHLQEKYDTKRKRISCIRSLHTATRCFFKIYLEVENVHARSYLENNVMYASTLIKPMDIKDQISSDKLDDILSQDWSCRSAKDVYDAFRKASLLSSQLSLDVCSPRVENLCSAVIGISDTLQDSELLDLLQYLTLWPPAEEIKSNQYYSLWRSLDKACLKRIKTWDIDMNLLVIDHWARLNLARPSEFVYKSVTKISRKLERLTPQQFVQLMFYVNLRRQLPPTASKFEFEFAWDTLITTLSLEELAIVSMGFFKTQTHLRNGHLIEGILSRLESSFRNGQPPPPDSIMLASLLKVLRTGVHPTQAVELHCMLDAMLPHIKDFSLLCCLHVALVGTNIQIIHEDVVHSICERFVAEMHNCRIKDIERLAFILTLYNYDPEIKPCIYETMISEIRKGFEETEENDGRWKEIHKHGDCVLKFLGFLTLRNIFPLDIIERAIHPDFIKLSCGNRLDSVKRELLLLDQSLEIYFHDQTNLRLCPKFRKIILAEKKKEQQKMLSHLFGGKRLNAGNNLLMDVFENIKLLAGNADGVSLQYVLPQFQRPDIVFCIGRNKNFQNLSLHKWNHETVQSCPSDHGSWYAVLIGGQNSYLKLKNKPAGSLVSRISLMKKLGYKPIVVPWFEWNNIKIEDKGSYLKQKIFNSEM